LCKCLDFRCLQYMSIITRKLGLEANTSKLALFTLSRFLARQNFDFVDCQQVTAHLISLGGQPIARGHYMPLLAKTLEKQSLHEPWIWDGKWELN